MQTVGFIGLGKMGAPMALNLLKAGFAVQAYDRLSDLANPLVGAGASRHNDAHGACTNADVIISMLPASEHVESLYLGESGLLQHLSPGTLIVDCSTIAPASARRLHDAAHALGLAALDAPVSGGTTGAQAGTLTFIVGGLATHLQRARPFFDAMGKNIFHAGDAGAGQTAKIANNMMLGIMMIGTAEALSLGVANGLDPKVLTEIMTLSSGQNWALDHKNPWPGIKPNMPAANGYQGGFSVDHMLKDLGLAALTALQSDRATPMGELARNLFALHAQQGHGDLDLSSIIKLIDKKNTG
jgi:3-hydroxyisobutyrate dehydrogenase